MEVMKGDAKMNGQAEIWRCMFAFADTMALKCAVELRIADIIHTHGNGLPMPLSDIAKHIDSSSSPANPAYLARIMRFLVRRNIFAAQPPSSSDDTSEISYSLTPASLWLLRDADLTLAPEILLENDKRFMEAYHYLSQTVKEGVVGFDVVYGLDEWTYTGKDPEFNKMFNEGMACTAKVTMRTIVNEYKKEFEELNSLVDVGGGIGSSMIEIVKAYPHINGIVFDLPHVVETAPPCNGITYVGGDMFKSVPKADAVFMKWVCHDWGEDACVKILKNCRKAIPEDTGKVILAEIVLQPEGTEPFDEGRLGLDMDLLAHNLGGKERTELQWKKLLAESGFPRYKIIKIPALVSLIEAYPN